MTLTAIDWIIIAIYLAGCVGAGIRTRRYVRDLNDFALAGRQVDVNLGVASLAATEIGIVTVMYTGEMGFKSGLAGAAPGVLLCLAMLMVGMTGFVIGPLRDAGVVTIPELFEKRFGTKVRWLAGLVVVLGGVLNMGIFLRLGGEFLMYIVGLSPKASFSLSLFGQLWHPGLLEVTMTFLLVLILTYTVLGGMVSVLVTDYLQFLVKGLGIVIISVVVFWNTNPLRLIAGLDGVQSQTRTAGSMTMTDPFNPFHSLGYGWVIWQSLLAVAVMTTWQTIVARALAAKDARIAGKIYRGTAFYFVGRFSLPGLWGAAAFLYFASAAAGGLPDGIGSLAAMPVYLGRILPAGILGIVVVAMLAAEMSTDSGYLLTWATVIYNDLVSPCLKRPMSQRSKLLTVRLLLVAIGIFLLFYGLWYRIPGRAWDYLSVTGNIYLASLFTLLVGALYWRLANSWGALASIVLGAIGPITFLVVNAIVEDPARQISPETAGLSAFGMAFAGMVFGSLAGRMAGVGAAVHPTEVVR
jgi:solute:Na+ symporter, SSS family